MKAEPAHFTFLVSGPGVDHIGQDSLCYRLPAFPPPEDFPVMVDRDGQPISRYGDSKWRIGSKLFNFGKVPSPAGLSLDDANSELLKRCLCWFMYGDRRAVGVTTLAAYHTALKPIFAFCSSLPKPIVASDMTLFFEHMANGLARAIRPGSAKAVAHLLQELWLARAALGFSLLDPRQIARIRQLLPEHEVRQTHCIPPRIWSYQAQQLRAFLEDFVAHKAKFEAAYTELIDAYRGNFGELKAARGGLGNRNPCHTQEASQVRGCVYLGSFASLARRHGISDVILRWVFGPGTTWDERRPQGVNVQLMSQYFNAVGRVGTAYLQCFSGMRISEAMSLRCDCLTVEHDRLLGDVYILRGETSKTTQDDDARWLAAPTVALAVDAMSAVARLRTNVAIELGFVPLSQEDIANPYLVQRAYEPWGSGKSSESITRPLDLRPAGYEIGRQSLGLPGLFDENVLRITSEDEAFVRRLNANVDMARYSAGCVWPLTSHQYRRTAAVMMASSQISLESQQYQFKHLTLNQSAYYRRGAQSLRLNRTFSYELLEVRYEMVAVDFALLNGPEFISPISSTRKDQILEFHEMESGDALQRAIRRGELAVKQTLFGVCTRRDKCPYGGHDNFAHCPDCNDALLNKRKRSKVEALGKTIAVRLVDAPLRSPLRAHLERSALAIERFMNATA
ncbi:hypothetical protein WCE34_13060 [Luteimonas sp. MJ204]|uniref:hypothetical protein n=1 Tax=Luteimonas sp. MJ145 TaxID=3129234 RepID=UPI0031BB678F